MGVNQMVKFKLGGPWVHSVAVFGGFALFYTIVFAPGLVGERVLAFDDGIRYFLPAYNSPLSLWTDLVFGGYPVAADPQNMTWYPVAALLRWIPGSWNVFFGLGYVLAASFAYCYAYTLTRSRLASVVGGLVYSLTGCLMSHMSVVGMIHAAAWIPLLLAALERLCQAAQPQRQWRLIGTIAVVGLVLGGHPQFSVYGLGLGGGYALWRGGAAVIGRWRYYGVAFGMLAIGMGCCAIQLIPAAELSRLSVRAALTEDAFFAGSVARWQVLQYVFPWLFGSDSALAPYRLPYWGKEANIVDIATYVGLLPLLLAVVGYATVRRRQRPIMRFWLMIGLVSFILTFGRYSGLAKLIYYVPIYNAFRIPARHSLELGLAVSVLASYGVAAIQQQRVPARILRRTIAGSLIVMIGAIGFLASRTRSFQALARAAGIPDLRFWPWENAAVAVPLIVCIVGLLTIVAWYRWPRSPSLMLGLLAVMTLDLGSFGFWFYDLAAISPYPAQLQPHPIVQQYQPILAQTSQRLMIERGIFATSARLAPDSNPTAPFPNLTRLWNLPVLNGYSPLMLSRLSELIGFNYAGEFPAATIADQHRGLDLMAVRYLWGQPNGLLPTRTKGLNWAAADLPIVLGTGATPAIDLELPRTESPTTAIALVSTLGNAVTLSDNTAVLDVQAIDQDGTIETHPLIIGRDTAEQAYDCPDVQPQMRHRRATVFKTTFIARPSVGLCPQHQYQTIVELDRPRDLRQLRLRSRGQSGSIVVVPQISLWDSRSQTALPIPQITASRKWYPIESFADGVLYENAQALPRTWLVPQILPLPPEAIRQTIQTSRLPNGEIFQPEKIALVETGDRQLDPLLATPMASGTGTAQVITTADTQVEIETTTATPAFLVLSDVNYPGWQVMIDGRPAPIVPTNYVQRGVPVPAGTHRVRFEFHPLSFRLGAGISMLSLLRALYWLIRRPARQTPKSPMPKLEVESRSL
jgi:hypothetical protein